jgi:hypothetical protein
MVFLKKYDWKNQCWDGCKEDGYNLYSRGKYFSPPHPAVFSSCYPRFFPRILIFRFLIRQDCRIGITNVRIFWKKKKIGKIKKLLSQNAFGTKSGSKSDGKVENCCTPQL